MTQGREDGDDDQGWMLSHVHRSRETPNIPGQPRTIVSRAVTSWFLIFAEHSFLNFETKPYTGQNTSSR